MGGDSKAAKIPMAVVPVTHVMRGDTRGWFLIDTGGLSPVDYRSISDRSHECGYRLFGFREGAMVVAFPSTRLRGRAVISGAQAAHLFPLQTGSGNPRLSCYSRTQ